MGYLYLISFSLFFSSLCSEESSTIQRYLHLYQTFPNAFGPKGDCQQGQIEIIDDPQQMELIQESVKKRLLEKGLSQKEAESRSRVGVVQEDAYWMWIRDAVVFPTGPQEIYNRFIHKKSLIDDAQALINGVGVLAVFPNQKILLNVIFRHATRHWEIEIPRGGRNKNETLEATAQREVQEETGYEVEELNLLGTMPFDSGAMTYFNAVFFARIGTKGKASQGDEEVIAASATLSKKEIAMGFLKGKIEVVVNGQTIKALCRDPLLSFALFIAATSGRL